MTSELMNEPLSIEVTVNNRYGLHLRCCNEIARLAAGFSSKITLSSSRRQADAKSMLNLATLAAAHGTQLTVTAVGDDARQALEAMREYFGRETSEQV